MKSCPKCYSPPAWHLAANASRKRGERCRYYSLYGCSHAMELAKGWGFVAHDALPTFEAKWDAEAERMFAVLTERWTEPQRVHFRVRLLWVTPPRELNLVEDPAPAVDAARRDEEAAF